MLGHASPYGPDTTQDRWLKRHPNVHFHFTPPTRPGSIRWNVGSAFSAGKHYAAAFTSPPQLRQAIDDFVAAYNQSAAPFEWKKAVVFPSNPNSKYSDLCK